MLYRIFRRTDANARYLLTVASDVDVKGTFEDAAREWADRYAPGGVSELDLMIGRFSTNPNRIGELFPIKLKRSPSPWVRVNTYTPDCTCDEDDNF